MKFCIMILSAALIICVPVANIRAESVDDMVKLGEANYNRGNFHTAYDYFKKAVKTEPTNKEASRWFWKMKGEHDVSKLSDRGAPITSLSAAATDDGGTVDIKDRTNGGSEAQIKNIKALVKDAVREAYKEESAISEKAARERYEKDKAEREKAELEKSGRELAEREKTEIERAKREKELLEKAEREKALREKALREKAEKLLARQKTLIMQRKAGNEPDRRRIDEEIRERAVQLAMITREKERNRKEMEALKEAEYQAAPQLRGAGWQSSLLWVLLTVLAIAIVIFLIFFLFYRARIRRIPVRTSSEDYPENRSREGLAGLERYEEDTRRRKMAIDMARSVYNEGGSAASLASLKLSDDPERLARELKVLLGHREPGGDDGEKAVSSGTGSLVDTVESYTEGYLKLMEYKFTYDTSRQVKILVEEMGLRLGLSKMELKELAVAALLENVGYLRLPEALFHKRSRLEKKELTQVRLHPGFSAEIIRAMGLPESVAMAAQCHHERYDGRGYPAGVRGSAIPRFARIIGLCDSYTALTTDRPHRAALSAADALGAIQKDSFLFDPEMMKVLFDVVELVRSSDRGIREMSGAGVS